MAFDRRHVVAQWGGTLPGGEIWSNMLRLSSSETGDSASVPTDGDMQEWMETTAKDAVAAFHAAAETGIHGSAKLTFLKLNVVNMAGRYVQATTHEYVYPTPISGGGGSTLHPNQVALVVSTTTGLSRGPAHRGRFYLPLPAAVLNNITGVMGTAAAAAVAAAASTFIEALADTPGPDLAQPMRAVVMSQRAGQAATHVITGVEVGVVLDTQRRRRTELPEDYQSAVVDQGAW